MRHLIYDMLLYHLIKLLEHLLQLNIIYTKTPYCIRIVIIIMYTRLKRPSERSIGIMVFFPKKVDFFEPFDKTIDNLSKATDTLVAMFKDYSDAGAKTRLIHDLEQEGGILTRDIMKELNKTFLTPIDREDIHALASRIDDVLDLIRACVDRMSVYKIEK